jgi:hypothetical protein
MDDDTKLVLIDNSAMALFETRADELIISGNKEELKLEFLLSFLGSS